MSRQISKLPALVLVALALLIAGCGSGDDGPTRAEFIKEAEVICKKANSTQEQRRGEYIQTNFKRLQREPPPPDNTRSTAEVVREIRVPITLKEVEELEALEPPEGDEEELRKIFAGTKEGLKELSEDPQLVWASRAGNPLYPSYKAATEYGFGYCAEA